MEDKRKIKDIYDCAAIISDEELYPLQKWYNQLIDKTLSEITVADVLRMIRQKQFKDIAISKAIKFLQDDVFIGESYDGQLLEKISEMDRSFFTSYTEDIKRIAKNALEKSEIHEWSYEGEKDEFQSVAQEINEKFCNN